MQLVLNAGSSSLKWSVFAGKDEDRQLLSGNFDGIGAEGGCTLRFGGRTEKVEVSDHAEAVRYLLSLLERNSVLGEVDSVVHRVVHGGEKYHSPVRIDEEVERDIESLSALAPLHNPANLSGIRAAKEVFPDAPQVAVFDTAFHHTISREVFLYGLPLELYEKFHIRKYGFHGISHSYIADQLEERYGSPTDAISCHLGSGSSITALKDGHSVDTTMGFTPLDGLLMATRSGELDPEIPLFLLREGHYSVEELDDLLSKRSGLLGISGHADLRDVWKTAGEGDADSRLALSMLAYRIAYYINALRTAVPDPKAIVFTAGIGEQAWYVRESVCGFLGLPLDEEANRSNAQRISAEDSPVDVLVLHTDEQLQMHRLARKALGGPERRKAAQGHPQEAVR